MLFIQTQTLLRADALKRIRLLSGKDLRPLADVYGVTVWKNGRKNKGWAGQVIEQYLGLRQNSLQAPDFGSWELKVVPLAQAADGTLRVKESMAITMIRGSEVVAIAAIVILRQTAQLMSSREYLKTTRHRFDPALSRRV